MDGEMHPTFKTACFALKLLEDDKKWIQCLEEAGEMQTGQQLHSLFTTLLLHCNLLYSAEL
jgi:hypothetical protein